MRRARGCTAVLVLALSVATAVGASKPASSAAGMRPSRLFDGNCFTFRNGEWGYAQQLANLQAAWWTRLQHDYNGNYPLPTPTGSVPGATVAQTSLAAQDMRGV